MKLFGYKNNVDIKNISGGRIAMGKFALAHNDSKVINPQDFGDDIVKALDIFLEKGKIEAKFEAKKKDEAKADSNVVQKESLKNEKGETHEHTVYDPETAKKNKLIEVESLNDTDKAVAVNSISKEEAEEFLAQHWKKIEKEVEKISDVKKLGKILDVAKELGMDGNKKFELIEDRIENLK
jgi:hypothetical protein